MLLTFSIRRYSSSPLHIAEALRARNPTVIAICDNPTVRLIPQAHHHLPVRTR